MAVRPRQERRRIARELRWHCDPATLPFETTKDVATTPRVVGQSAAVDALSFGLETTAPGQNIFIRGITGTGRMTLVQRLLKELSPPCKAQHDRCYVHNFAEPERPRLLTLPAGKARAFRRQVQELAEFVRDGLWNALESEPIKVRREALQKREKEETTALTGPFESALKEANLALVTMQLGPIAQTAIFYVSEGKPIPPEEYETLRAKGEVSDEENDAIEKRKEQFQKRLEDVTAQIREIRRRSMRRIHAIVEEFARTVLGDMAREILVEFQGEDVQRFLSEIVDDVAEHRLTGMREELPDPVRRYGVNILSEHEEGESCPIVVENTPNLVNLLGFIDREWTPRGPAPSDYTMIRAGSLLRADGGYLILDARDILTEQGGWRVLVRTLRNDVLEIVPSEFSLFGASSIKPEPIPLNIKVILIGDAEIYYLLDRYDPDFGDLFKCLADFNDMIRREPDGMEQYSIVLAHIAKHEDLPHFDRTAVAALAEHGARIASRRGKLTARFARIADIAREAAFLAQKANAETVTATEVRDAIRRTRRRADLPSRRFREYLADGTIQIQTKSEVVGQINGLAVMSAGPITYGFPARITASVGAGQAGIINIEGQAQLSGSIHTKGFHILGGLLRHLLQTDHPLAFSASVAFEQSYGGIDGDSASGAEICCLLSALTGVPIRQNIAMTGAIDQQGHIQAIGGVNEKIEGFFDTCKDLGLSGDQGVIIPRTNAGDLMLKPEVVEACEKGQFRVYAVSTVHEALEVLMGIPAGERDEDGLYPEGTLLAQAVDKAREFWLRSRITPAVLAGEEEEEEEGVEPKS